MSENSEEKENGFALCMKKVKSSTDKNILLHEGFVCQDVMREKNR